MGGFNGAWLDRHGIRPSYLGLGGSPPSGSGGPSSETHLQKCSLQFFLDPTQEKPHLLSWSEDWQIHGPFLVPLMSASHQHVQKLSNDPNFRQSGDCRKLGSLQSSQFFMDSPIPLSLPDLPSQKLLPMPLPMSLVNSRHADVHL